MVETNLLIRILLISEKTKLEVMFDYKSACNGAEDPADGIYILFYSFGVECSESWLGLCVLTY